MKIELDPAYQVTVRATIDDPARDFEARLRARPRRRAYDDTPLPLQLNLYQSVDWLEHSRQDFRLIQVADAQGQPVGQVAAVIKKPRGLSCFAFGEVAAFGTSCVSNEDEFWILRNLPEILSRTDKIMALRIRAYRHEFLDLADFASLARRAGYETLDPIGVSRTISYPIEKPLDELLADLSKQSRAQIRHRSREELDIRVLTEPRWAEPMKAALDQAHVRTGKASASFDFDTVFRVAGAHPESVLILGVFLRERPEQLVAYAVDIHHGDVVEAVSSGSLGDPELRKTPFNYFLFWQKVEWAKSLGAKLVDLGGVTDGGKSDPLAGISTFKRRLTKVELNIGQEMGYVVSPFREALFRGMDWLASSIRRKRT
jgi:hypothetical protein